MSIEIKIIVDGTEYEFVPKETPNRPAESLSNGSETPIAETENPQSTQPTPEVSE